MFKGVLSSVAMAVCLPAVVVVAAQESIALDIQIYLNGTHVGSPTITIAEGETGSLRLPDVLDVEVTPTRQDAGRVRVALEFADAAGTWRPALVIDEEHPGVLTIPSTAGDENEVELRIGVSSN